MPRHLVRAIIFSLPCAVFCASAPAHAQAVDSFNPGTNGVVIALATQPDGKLLVGGSFGQLGGAPRNDLGRFNSDGSLDANFNPGVSGEVFTLVVQPDGKILVGGSFTMLGGGGQGTVPRQNIGRLNADGSIDATFDPGTDGLVEALALQPDGKILVGGFFTRLGGGATGTVPRRNLGRLNSDGSIDPGFNPGTDLPVYTIALQPDDKILIGGIFSTLSGGARSFIGRLESDGSLDPTFDPGASGGVISLVVQADGRILVVGAFTLLGGGGIGTTPRRFIGRLHADGSLDAGFDPGVDHGIASVGIQTNGQILVGGFLTMLGGGGLGTTPRNYLGRLGPDGSLDALFNPGANSAVSALVLQADGKVVVAGAFTGLGGGSGATPRNRIGRVTNTDPATQTLTVTGGGSVINWSRGGSAPEVWRVTFESSGDGVNYTPLGRGTRVAGGWQLSGQNLPPSQNLSIRARGYYVTGGGTITGGGSGSIVESILALQGPSFTVTPVAGANGTINPGTPQSVPPGQTRSFTLAPASGYRVDTVTGTCGGTLAGLVFTTNSVVASCTVVATFVALPTLALDKTSLTFGAVTTGAAFVSQTAAQIVRLTQTGAGTATWTATSSQPWLQVSPASGTGSATLTISIASTGGLPTGGIVAGSIAFSVGAATAPGPIGVNLSLILNGMSANPFGIVDTPTDNRTGVTGAVPFTGWALDDVEVTRVMICRAAFGAEVAPVDPNCGGTAQIFVGFAVSIDSARPDVVAAFPAHPANTRAGWGFMVLTNMLPSQGNGTYQFIIWAQDREGHSVVLGTRTMTCANASATLPFGAIDTPTQGGVASGTNFVNFGWALTPLPKTIPVNGSTISVLVDGVPVGTADYNHPRPDIAALFPGLNNTNGAIGFRVLDTTTLANGLHTISWTVTDNQGAIEGIGSRFFTVSNGASSLTAATIGVEGRSTASVARGDVDVEALPLEASPILGRRGWDLQAPYRAFAASASGRLVVRSEEVNRVELRLGGDVGSDSSLGRTRYQGFLRAGTALAPLPIGAHLDGATGAFTWAPGLGFVGPYDLVFIRSVGARPVARQEVRIVLHAKGRGSVGPQVEIDAPKPDQRVSQPFLLSGWAADLNALFAPGVTTLHTWAYPVAGGPPLFLGATTFGGSRQDVAAVHGDQFRDSGFELRVLGLAPGQYDLAVFAWSTEAAGFVAPKSVRVTVQ